VLSNFQKKFLIDIGIHQNKLFLYQNPIEINKKLLSEYNSSSKYVVFAGRLVDNKGINELLDIWTRLNPKNLNLKIIGSGENDKFLLEKYDSPSIEFLGHLDNNKVKELIRKSRAVVTGTKLFEGQPRVLLEASSYGVPSLYPSFGGMNDFFPKNYLFTFKQYDYDDLFIKISNFENEELLNQESQRIIDHVSLNFSEEVLIGKFKKIMDNS
jgi:glycosyltransferase involved in cell wall biosynthesis